MGEDRAGDRAGAVPEVVVVPVEDHLDLHSFLPREVGDVVAHYLDCATAAGYREVRIIHGRGTGTQRRVVRGVLERHPRVRGFADAPLERGGIGATIAVLEPDPLTPSAGTTTRGPSE